MKQRTTHQLVCMERTPTPVSQNQILLGYENTDEPYLTLSFTLVLMRENEILYLPLDLVNSLTIDALVDLGTFVTARAELDRIKQQAATKNFKIDCPSVKVT